MKIRSQYLKKLGGLGIATMTRHWMGTLEFQHAAYDRSVDPASEDFAGPAIYLFWHEYIPFLFYLRGHCQISMLVSKHGDAEWLSCAAKHMGFSLVRGSTNRGGGKAIRQMITASRDKSIAITPDGPRGPRRKLAPGPIYLASRTGLPLVLCGLGYSDSWRLSTWDKLALPKPGARARIITSPRIFLDEKLNRDEREQHRVSIESTLNQLTELADEWAVSGRPLEGAVPAARKPMPVTTRRRLRGPQTLEDVRPASVETGSWPPTVAFTARERAA